MKPSIRRLTGFDDPSVGASQWESLLGSGTAQHVYLTREFQRAWWETLGGGELLLFAAERGGRDVALAPLYTDAGMVYFVGSAFDSDYLDFIGDVSDPEILDALLAAARDAVPGFLGFRLYFVSDAHGSGDRIAAAAARLGLTAYEEHEMHAAELVIAGRRAEAEAIANKRRLRKRERTFTREAPITVTHLRSGAEILPLLPAFFEQHVARWADTPTPSRFVDSGPRDLVQRFTELAAETGWMRFTQVEWKDRVIAFHYGFRYRDRFYWGMPSFDPDLARMSPGQLLVRQLLLAAIEEEAAVFDFGTGTQPFKLRFSNRVTRARTWGLFPTGSESP